MNLWIWRNLRIELPDDWEMLQFSKRAESGNCAFADRHDFRLEMNWKKVAGEPDFERMMSDYESRMKQEERMPDARQVWAGSWRGLEGHEDGYLTSRYGKFMAGESCLVELVFLWPEAIDTGLQAAILETVGEESPGPSGFRRWRAFGMDLLASERLKLHQCAAEPGAVKMVFRPRRGSRGEEVFERRGMVPEWLKSSLRDWLKKRAEKEAQIESQVSDVISGHELVRFEGWRRPEGFGGPLRRKLDWQCSAWQCPGDGRVYACSLSGPRGGPSLPVSRRLSCCNRFGVTDASEG